MAVLAVLAVAFAALAGPIRWSPPRWRFAAPGAAQVTSEPQPSFSAAPAPADAGPNEVQRVLMLVVLLVACVAAAVLLYRILRRLGAVRRVRQDAAAHRIEVTSAGEVIAESAPAAAPIVRGLARALQILDDERSADDAIVRAWLGLEEASAASGAGRRPAETPSEYAARVVARFDTDRRAAAVLLDLYQGVRFGGRHADAASIDAARESIRRLADSWHEDAEVKRR
ncbi:hypothetical protein LK09_13645 [Microbacterium mangrovi]|uniref:Protein-glutamine gamma-glutamyltransferase-like C-terminal domain-containing protein n=1 Tax=Microbacterium mangrovi TaxID=1348253 RepID=A0A0B2A5L6_9MICO|nr:hypothetical protein LK09_13645 [Microbacterium mangrovi]